jgi:hypothetical protein
LKRYYKNPLKVLVINKDDEYSKIKLSGHLPNREYYLMLLLSWPERSAYDKTNFIIKNALIKDISTILENIGLIIDGGRIYA